MQDNNARLSRSEAFQVLQGWKNLVQIEKHPYTCQGKITSLSPGAGTVAFSARVNGEQEPLVFAWADADFQWFPSLDPEEEWEGALVVFPGSGGDSITLRRWKKE